MRNKIILVAVAVWVIFSLAYILYDVWSDYKINQIGKAYQQGRIDTINTLILETEKSCNPVPVSSGEKQIRVINATCLDNK